MKDCDECGEPTKRRTECGKCLKMLCRHCFHHSFHAVIPQHLRGFIPKKIQEGHNKCQKLQ